MPHAGLLIALPAARWRVGMVFLLYAAMIFMLIFAGLNSGWRMIFPLAAVVLASQSLAVTYQNMQRWRKLAFSMQDGWEIADNHGVWHKITLQPDSVRGRKLVILNFQLTGLTKSCKNNHAVTILPHDISAENFRKLQKYLLAK